MLVATLGLAVVLAGSVDVASARSAEHLSPVAPAAEPPVYVSLLFSRTEITAADDCVATAAGVAKLDTVVAPWLSSLGFAATGTLTTGVTKEQARTCVHYRETMAASWRDAAALATTYGWTFVSHTATYPPNLETLTPARSLAETCGSASAIDAHGLPGGHGLIAYPGAQSSPVPLHTTFGQNCFAWGRTYTSTGVTLPAAGTTAPYWQNTKGINGGACNVRTAPCWSIPTIGNPRYNLPAKVVAIVDALQPGQWFTLQAYLLVRGKSPAYTTNATRWDCTSADPNLHWTNDNERYCYNDWQQIIRAVKAKQGVVVTDPLTVGVAFGRPATYP